MASLNFSDVQCNQPLTGSNLRDNATALADKMGLSSECKKMAEHDFTVGQMSAQIKIPFAKMRADASFTNSNNKMTQSGCGQFMLNSSNILNNVQKIKCLINENQNNTSVNVSSGNKIIIRTLPLSKEEELSKREILKGYTPAEAGKISPEMIKEYKTWLDAIIGSYDRSLTITNTKLIQKSDVKVKTLGSFSKDQISELESAYKDIAKDVVKNNIEKTIGTNAMDENTKSVVLKNTESNLTDSSQNIQKTLNSIKVITNSNNETIFESNGKMLLDNFQFTQETVIDQATAMIVADAIKDGMKAMVDTVKETSIETVEKKEVAGMDKVIDSVGDVNAKVIKAQNLEDFSPIVYIVIAVIAIFVIIAIGMGMYMVAKKKGSSSAIASSISNVASIPAVPSVPSVPAVASVPSAG